MLLDFFGPMVIHWRILVNFLGGLEDCTTWQCWAITSRVFSCADCGTHHNGCAMVKGEHLQRPSLYHGKRFADHDVSWIPWYGLLARRAFSWSLREKYQSWRKWEILRSMSNLPSPKADLVKQAIEMFRKKPTKTVGFNSGGNQAFFLSGGFCEAQRYLGKLKQPFSLPLVSRFCPSNVCVFRSCDKKMCMPLDVLLQQDRNLQKDYPSEIQELLQCRSSSNRIHPR